VEHNDRMDELYEAHLGVKYDVLVPAAYDEPICRTPSATTRDLEISFYQLPVPKTAWATQRFRDRHGNLYELVVSCMGNTLSAERMTIVTLTLGFAPGYSKVTVPGTDVHGHIDNLRCCGKENAQRQWARLVDTRAKQVNATFSPTDRADCATEYTFCGRQYDHAHDTVAIAPKTLAKLKDAAFEPGMRFDEWEQSWSRLIHSAQIVTVDWTSPERWVAMYWSRKILSLAGHGVIHDSDAVRVPSEVWTLWKQWHKETLQNTPRKLFDKKLPIRFIVFVDATLRSYGGVLVDLLMNQVHSFGALFHDVHTNINVAETEAVDLALNEFDLPSDAGIAVCIDNSSAEAAARNLKSRSWAVNKALHPLATKHLRRRHVEVFRIGTAENPSDEPSRLREVNALKVEVATRNIVAKGCGKGACFLASLPSDPA
jgi:hypothetical protein